MITMAMVINQIQIMISPLNKDEHKDTGHKDTEGDEVGDNTDLDHDSSETVDTDGDLVSNDADTEDNTDGESVGNNTDTDNDHDGHNDQSDASPLNKDEHKDTGHKDTEGDEVGDNTDLDHDSSETVDTDGDLESNDADTEDNTDGESIGAEADDDHDSDNSDPAPDVSNAVFDRSQFDEAKAKFAPEESNGIFGETIWK